jgi:hypothetical protein
MSTFAFLSFFAIVVGLPVVLGVGNSIFSRWLKHKEAMATAMTEQMAERAAHYAAKVERLEQRMAVMERILTDRSTVLADEIEQLRERPAN